MVDRAFGLILEDDKVNLSEGEITGEEIRWKEK